MARIKYEINEDSTLVTFQSLQFGEAFVYQGEPYMVAFKDGKAVSLEDGTIIPFENTELVTYVKKAELKLTI